MKEITNKERAEFARAALEAYARNKDGGYEPNELDTILTDLLADLMHLIGRSRKSRKFFDRDLEIYVDCARDHYVEELQEEEDKAGQRADVDTWMERVKALADAMGVPKDGRTRDAFWLGVGDAGAGYSASELDTMTTPDVSEETRAQIRRNPTLRVVHRIGYAIGSADLLAAQEWPRKEEEKK